MTVWDNMKAFWKEINQVNERVIAAKTTYVLDRNPTNCSSWVEAQSQLKSLMQKIAGDKQFLSKNLIWAEDERTGKLLATIAHSQTNTPV